jgi:hypothetical protein
MKIIDAHVHLPFGEKDLVVEIARRAGVDYSRDGLEREMRENNVEKAVVISVDVRQNQEVKSLGEDRRFIPIACVSVRLLDQLLPLRKDLEAGNFKGLKLYPGYEQFLPQSKRCEGIYRIAEKYDIPVIFHTGMVLKTFAKNARLRFAHPLNLDEVASKHPCLRIVMAHAGNPWVEDAAAVAYKNENVWLDISGWFEAFIPRSYGALMRAKLNALLAWCGAEKLIYGSDWPLLSMRSYIEFVSKSLARSDSKNVFYRNAKKVFE